MTDHRFPHVIVTTGVPGAEQRTSCGNGTLQYLEPGIDMTIETRIAVSPDEVIQGEDAVATHVRRRLEMAENCGPRAAAVAVISTCMEVVLDWPC